MKGQKKTGTRMAFFLFIFFVILISYFILVGFDVKPTAPSEDHLVLITPQDLAEGSVVSVPQMKWEEFPLDKILPEHIKKNQHDVIRSIEGAIVRIPFVKGDAIKEANLIKTGTKSALSAVIHEGMRAVPVPFSKISNAPPLIAPGDIVDIIIPKRDMTSLTGDPIYVGHTILRNIRVLAIDTALQKNELSDIKGGGHTLTLEVDSAQAEDLGASLRDGQVIISMHSIFTDLNEQVIRKEEQKKPEVKNEEKVIKVIRGTDKKAG